MRRVRIFLAALAGSTVAVLLVLLVRSPASDCGFEGKPLDQWLEAGYEDMARVLYEVGPSAAESIFTKVKWEHPQYGRWARYRSLWNQLPVLFRKVAPQPRSCSFDEWRASQALLAIGPQVIPSLAGSLGNHHFLVRSVSAQALSLLRKQGANISAAVPALRTALQDSDPGVRAQAAAALAWKPER